MIIIIRKKAATKLPRNYFQIKVYNRKEIKNKGDSEGAQSTENDANGFTFVKNAYAVIRNCV